MFDQIDSIARFMGVQRTGVSNIVNPGQSSYCIRGNIAVIQENDMQCLKGAIEKIVCSLSWKPARSQ